MENNLIVSLVLPLALGIIMFGMGSTLVMEDFKRVIAMPKAVAVGAVGQLLLLPIMGYVFALLFQLSPVDSVGLMILVACAGGAVSNLVVYLIKGDVALSVTLTAISCVVTIFTIPFIVNFALAEFMHANEATPLPIGSTNLKLFFITLLPVFLGMLLRQRWPRIAFKIEKPLNKIATTFFILIIASMIIKERHNLAEVVQSLGPVAWSLNAFMMALGFAIARLFKLNSQQGTAISIEIGLQNSATGIFIGASLLGNSDFATMPAVYSLAMMTNTAILAAIVYNVSNLRTARKEEQVTG